jgi:hypothetical protein
MRTAKSCGPDAPMAGVKFLRSSRFLGATVTSKPGLTGESTKISRKTIAQGRPGLLPLNLYARVRFCLCLFARETAGAARTRSSLRPSWDRTAPSIFWDGMNLQNSGAVCRENAELRLCTTSQPSSSAKADDPVFRGVHD